MDEDVRQILQQTQTYRVDHLPIVKAYCQRLGLIDTINTLVESEMSVSVGVVVQAMVIDTLSGRSPLYRLSTFFAEMDTELLLGSQVAPNALNDTTVGRALDRIYDVGAQAIFSQLAWKACQLHQCDLKHLHFDTTSVSVHGDYQTDDPSAPERLNITHGYSKDKRPDLKQFLLQTLCVEKNIPLLGGCEDGNTSDKTINNQVLSQLTRNLEKYGLQPGAFIYIADSAMVTEGNLNLLDGNRFITRLPATYLECDRAIHDAVAAGDWKDIGVIAETQPTKNRPVAQYRVAESQVTLYGKNYRAVVVHSSAHDKRRQKRLQKTLTDEQQRLQTLIKQAVAISYACQTDAESACQRLEATRSEYYSLQTKVIEKVIYQRGRPSQDQPRKIQRREYHIEVEIQPKQAAIERRQTEAGCFVMLTSVPEEGEEGYSGEAILRTYKDQHGVERNFSFLKDPLIVNDLFLKKPERIEVLGMVLLIALLIWNLMERNMRQSLTEPKQTLPGWDNKRTRRPTSFMMTTKFFGLMIMIFNGVRVLAKPLTPNQQSYLTALGLSVEIFTDPDPP